ncbi:MAG TPA: DegT/DnrJ/EryC1/StrS family aminotransferase [Solirubrobacteraceae bacterium]|jgi:dTDP-3-amino-3,4,6-trideoxy-alpha-D-glucose transaminase
MRPASPSIGWAVTFAPASDLPPVPFVALDRQHAALEHELSVAFAQVVRASAFVLGDEVAGFEAEFAAACGARACVGVASGTAALTLALRAAGIGAGDEVIVPAHTFVASALAVLHAGATPVFCDVEPDTALIDPASAATVITERTAAVLAVHLYGQACEMDALAALARRHGLLLVEDAAQAHGAGYRGRSVGSLGDVAAFSFYPTKNLGALGDAGAVCTDDLDLADRMRRLRHLGERRKGEHVALGYNERLDGMQAAFLRAKLTRLSAGNRARREAAAAYREGLRDLHTLVERDHTPSVNHLFPVRVADREAARAHLRRRGIETGVHYPRPAHRHPAWDGVLAEPAVPLPNATAWAAEELSLPMFPELRRDEIERVIAACADLPPVVKET